MRSRRIRRALIARAISGLVLIPVTASCVALAQPLPQGPVDARTAAAVAKAPFGHDSYKRPRGDGSARNVKRQAAPYAFSRPASSSGSVQHTVQKGQTIYRIALSYGITVQELCRANGLGDPNQVQVGRVLFIPRQGASPVSSWPASATAQSLPDVSRPAAALVHRTERAASDDASGRLHGGVPSSGAAAVSKDPVPATSGELPAAGAPHQAATHLPSLVPPDKVVSLTSKIVEDVNRGEGARGEDLIDDQDPAGSMEAPSGVSYSLIPSREPFSWPVQGGTLQSAFGRRWGRLHAGVDISVPLGSPVYSARDGQVVYSGHKYRGYGNVVLIDHGDGFVTVYAHNSRNIVREGEKVVRGQMIARVGATGNATGSHCHFEIRHGNLAIDPRKYLPASVEEDEMYATGVPFRATSPEPRAGLGPKPDPIP